MPSDSLAPVTTNKHLTTTKHNKQIGRGMAICHINTPHVLSICQTNQLPYPTHNVEQLHVANATLQVCATYVSGGCQLGCIFAPTRTPCPMRFTTYHPSQLLANPKCSQVSNGHPTLQCNWRGILFSHSLGELALGNANGKRTWQYLELKVDRPWASNHTSINIIFVRLLAEQACINQYNSMYIFTSWGG